MSATIKMVVVVVATDAREMIDVDEIAHLVK
jgi:hypothetical protein